MDSFISVSNQIESVRNRIEEEKSNLKADLTKLARQSQFHGIPRLLSSRNTAVKLIWSVFILASIGLCLYTIIDNIKLYLQFNVNTLVQMIPQHSLDLPVISVCNSNPFTTKKGFEHIANYYKKTYNITFSDFGEFYKMIEQKSIPDERDWIFYKTFEADSDPSSFGLRFDEQNLFCMALFEPCKREEFVRFYHPKYGNCFRFNSGFTSNGTFIGMKSAIIEEYGLQLGLFTGFNDFQSNQSQNGLVLMIDEHFSEAIDKKGILIRPGTWANIALRKTRSVNLPQPYNDCRNDDFRDTFVARQLRKYEYYGRRNCMTLCRQMMIIEKLGCYDMRYPSLDAKYPCNDRNSYEKLNNIDLNMSRCEIECPFECQTTIYDWDISYARFPAYRTYKIINNTNYTSLANYLHSNRSYSYSDSQKSVAGFFVYYDPLTVTQVTQSPSMLFADLVANIGGLLGLFLGLSLLSLVEFLEFGLVLFEAVFR